MPSHNTARFAKRLVKPTKAEGFGEVFTVKTYADASALLSRFGIASHEGSTAPPATAPAPVKPAPAPVSMTPTPILIPALLPAPETAKIEVRIDNEDELPYPKSHFLDCYGGFDGAMKWERARKYKPP